MVKRIPIISSVSDGVLPYFPELDKKLKIAEMKKDVKEFMDSAILNSIISSIVVFVVFLAIFFIFRIDLLFALPVLIVMFFFSFFNLTHIPDLYLIRRKRDIEYDIVYGTRQLVIEISSGMPLFDAMVTLTKGYGQFSEEMKRIVERVTLGEPISLVLKDVADKTPSPAFKRVLLQLANAIVSGADVGKSLDYIVDQIVRDQIIEVKEYGHKLNPIIMFYLVVGVIFPTLGITFIIILLSFVTKGASIPFMYMILLGFLLGIFQLMFLTFVETSRPKYALLV